MRKCRAKLSTLSLHATKTTEPSETEEGAPLQRRNSIHNVPFVDVNDPETRYDICFALLFHNQIFLFLTNLFFYILGPYISVIFKKVFSFLLNIMYSNDLYETCRPFGLQPLFFSANLN